MGSYVGDMLIILILVGLNAYFAAAEIAILSVKEVRIRHLAESGNKAAQAVQRLTANASRMLATIQIGITLAGFMASASAAVGLSGPFGVWLSSLPIPGITKLGPTLAVVLVTLIISYFTLVLGELAPKRLALQKAESIALRVAQPVELLARVAGPVTAFLTFSTNLMVRLLGGNPNDQEDEVTEEEIKAFVAENGSLPEDEKEMIHSVFRFGDSVVSQMMVPRLDVVAIEAAATVNEAIDLIRESGYSRLPVYIDSIDNIVGTINLKDMLDSLADGRMTAAVSEIMKEPLFALDERRAVDLLRDMQSQHVHMAVVIDEYGGTAGIVTMENLVEMVVGDIRDEHDKDEVNEIELTGPGEAKALGGVAVGEINEMTGWRLPESADYETVGGLVSYALGRIPSVGEYVVVAGIRLDVEEMDRHRIRRVRLSKLSDSNADTSQ